jgi:hypothetical protein
MEQFLEMEEHRPLREHWEALSRCLFASESATMTWQGNELWAAFSRARCSLNRTSRVSQSSALPALNPTAASSATAMLPGVEKVK